MNIDNKVHCKFHPNTKLISIIPPYRLKGEKHYRVNCRCPLPRCKYQITKIIPEEAVSRY